MSTDKLAASPPNFGGWQDAERLRKWSFLQRTPQQRLDWLVQALTIAYQCGALKQAADPRVNSVVPWP
jgi:hypothetical protein